MTAPSHFLHWRAFARAAMFIARAQIVNRWAGRFLAERGLSAGETTFYTYWFYHSAHGLALAKAAGLDIALVTRAHNFDLYEDRYRPPYIPCRGRSTSLVDAVFPDSEAGSDYLVASRPQCRERVETSRMGVADPGFIAAPSSDGVFRIVSCSFMVPVKRLGLLADGLAHLAARRPDLSLEWTHFGDGPERSMVEEKMRAGFLPSLRATIMGRMSIDDIFDCYRNRPVDLFVNVSAWEGTPVTLMEAASCGIPILATSVGGNREVVRGDSGVLISADPSVEEIAAAIESLADDAVARLAMREGARRVWRERYWSDVNYRCFVGRLLEVRDGMFEKARRPQERVHADRR